MIQGEEDVILSTMDGDQQIVQRIQLLGNQLASIHESLINDNDQLVAEWGTTGAGPSPAMSSASFTVKQ